VLLAAALCRRKRKTFRELLAALVRSTQSQRTRQWNAATMKELTTACPGPNHLSSEATADSAWKRRRRLRMGDEADAPSADPGIPRAL